MLADAYKIASDIKNVMPDLIYDAIATIGNRKAAGLFKPKLKASMPPLKHRLSSIVERLGIYMTTDLVKYLISHTYISFKHMALVKDCLLEMTKYVDAMIYYGAEYGGNESYYYYRREPPGQTSTYDYAHRDLDGIVKAAVKCIDIIDKRVMPK